MPHLETEHRTQQTHDDFAPQLAPSSNFYNQTGRKRSHSSQQSVWEAHDRQGVSRASDSRTALE